MLLDCTYTFPFVQCVRILREDLQSRVKIRSTGIQRRCGCSWGAYLFGPRIFFVGFLWFSSYKGFEMERNSPAKFIKYLERLHKYSSVVEVIDDGQAAWSHYQAISELHLSKLVSPPVNPGRPTCHRFKKLDYCNHMPSTICRCAPMSRPR
jgi:hypothetical protein